ncbi:hypothetical protein JXM67_03210 [candidate division WOR-3 bacterium]|nr:hypothetical protein [candidate division WOR-3 bacterium]
MNEVTSTDNIACLGSAPSRCPHCDTMMEQGWLYNTSFGGHGIYWYDEPKQHRLVWRTGDALFRPKGMGRWVEARRCPKCKLVIFRSEEPHPRAHVRYGFKYLGIFLAIWFGIVILVLIVISITTS